MKKSKSGKEKKESAKIIVSTSEEWTGEQSDNDSEDEINREVVIYEESPEDRMPELVDLVPRETGVAEGNQDAGGVVEVGRGMDPAHLLVIPQQETPEPVESDGGIDPAHESFMPPLETLEPVELGDGIDPAHFLIMPQPPTPEPAVADGSQEVWDTGEIPPSEQGVVVALDQRSGGIENLDSGEEIIETSESESPSESESESAERSSEEVESNEAPVERKSRRVRTRKKVFTYDAKGQPSWEDAAEK